MSQEIDFNQLVELLDRALTSKDPKVIQALKKFLFIAALATEEGKEPGPFATLLGTVEELKRRVGSLEAAQFNFPNVGTQCWPQPTYTQPQWTTITTPLPGVTYTWGGTSISTPASAAPHASAAPSSGSGTLVGSASSSMLPPASASNNITYTVGNAGGSSSFVNYARMIEDSTRDTLDDFGFKGCAYDNLIQGALDDLDRIAEDK